MSTPSASSSLGFPRETGRPPTEPPARPTPLPKRPKGRWFVGLLLLAFSAFACHQVWQTYFRYQAYGTITGRTLHVAAPWDGLVRYLHVRPGDKVRQGQLLVTIDNFQLRQRIAQVADDLVVAQANLEADAAKLKWQAAYNLDNTRGAVAGYYESQGALLQEQAKLDDLHANLQRDRSLVQRQAIAREAFDQTYFQHQGQQRKVAHLRQALGELKTRAEQADVLLTQGSDLGQGLSANGADQLKPSLARIQGLLAERKRFQDALAQGELRAPANGTVIKSLRFAGESCRSSDPVLLLLEENSLQVVLYLPQEVHVRFAVGDTLQLEVEPHSEPLTCILERFGEEFEAAPEQIKRHYREGQKLLPAYLKPDDTTAAWMSLRVNEVVKLPGQLPNWFPGGRR